LPPRVDIKANAVPTRGSGFPDYSRAAAGSQQIAVAQEAGGRILAIVSGIVDVATSVSGNQINIKIGSETEQSDDTHSTVLRLAETTNAGNPVDTRVFLYALRNSNQFARLRSVGAFDNMVSGLEAAVGSVPHGSGELPYGYAVLSGVAAGEFSIVGPASGRSLVVRGLRAAHLGASGNLLVAWKFGSGNVPFHESVLTAQNPVDDRDLFGQEVRGPRHTVSGLSDLHVRVRPAPVSGFHIRATTRQG